MPEVLARVSTPRGEMVLRRNGRHHEVICDGMFLMDTHDGRSERLLVRAAVAGCTAARPRVLVGGLGVGFSLDEALADPSVREVVVVEREPEIVSWNREYLGRAAQLDDPRTRLVLADVLEWLADDAETVDALCLDVDNGPDWTVSDGNRALYGPGGVARLASRLAPGGVLTVWSAAASPAFGRRLRDRFADVRTVPVDVPRGEPDVVFVARLPRL